MAKIKSKVTPRKAAKKVTEQPPVSGEMEIMNIEEAAKFLKLSTSWLYKLKAKKEIPHIKSGKRVLFEKTELQAWLKKQSFPGTR